MFWWGKNVIFTINIWGSTSANVQVHNLAEWSRLFLNKLGSPRGEPSPTFRDEQRYTSTLCPRENVHGIHVDNQKCIEMHIDSIEPQLHLNLSKSFFFHIFRWSWGSVAVRLMGQLTPGGRFLLGMGLMDRLSWAAYEFPISVLWGSVLLLENQHFIISLAEFPWISTCFWCDSTFLSVTCPNCFTSKSPYPGGDQYCPSSGTSIWAVSVCQLLDSQGLSAIIDVAWSENRGYPQIAHLCSFNII